MKVYIKETGEVKVLSNKVKGVECAPDLLSIGEKGSGFVYDPDRDLYVCTLNSYEQAREYLSTLSINPNYVA